MGKWNDREYVNAYWREYNRNPENAARKLALARAYSQTPMGRYAHQKQAAKQRKIEWLLTFDEWMIIWEQSGHFNERGVSGYQMCRKGDEGPYSIDNIYIATGSDNKRDAYTNGKIPKPPNRWLVKESIIV